MKHFSFLFRSSFFIQKTEDGLKKKSTVCSVLLFVLITGVFGIYSNQKLWGTGTESDREKDQTQTPNRIQSNGQTSLRDRIQEDWLRQDLGRNDVSALFISTEWNKLEIKTVEKVLADLRDSGVKTDPHQKELEDLKKLPGRDPRWKAFYLKLCALRRQIRLADFRNHCSSVCYVKRSVLCGPGNIAPTFYDTDRQTEEKPLIWKPGAKLCLLTVQKDGSVQEEVLLEKPNGSIRDPELSFDAKTLLFSMRDDFDQDNYELYSMTLADRKVKRITHRPALRNETFPISNIEPCFLPNGRILYISTRCSQLDPCSWSHSGNMYTCLPDGSDIQRMGFDQVDLLYPKLLSDGRVIYTRWEYNDRTPILVQPLFVMNEDGTNQTEYYGNNSWWPVSLIHTRPIPGTSKVMSIASGHHVFQKGKLVVIDRTEGTQEGAGIEFIAGSSPDGSPGRKKADIHENRWSKKLDGFGQDGFQFAYPYPMNEDLFLVSFTPDGYQGFVRYAEYLYENNQGNPFGLYLMTPEGRRELLAFDSDYCCLQAIPIASRPVPPVRPSSVDYKKKTGTFYIQDIYHGPGLKDIPRGTVKKIRVVGLEYRTAFVGSNRNAGPGGDSCNQTPIGVDNACWDVKHVLGEADIEEDGSVFLEAPALQPVYFQMLDEKGKTVQTMRSWTMLMPGEQVGCLGCHENKLDGGSSVASGIRSAAMKRPAQKLQPFLGVPHPYLKKMENANLTDSTDHYLGINRIRSFDEKEPVEGFSYRQIVQPVLDRHCVRCHNGDKQTASQEIVPSSFLLTAAPVADQRAKRLFNVSYVTLTHNGKMTPLVNWIDAESIPAMLPPRFAGSSKSELMKYLEPDHYNVRLSENDKRAIACWLDLGVPFCGSYLEARIWNDQEKTVYDYFQKKREASALEELKFLKKRAQ